MCISFSLEMFVHWKIIWNTPMNNLYSSTYLIWQSPVKHNKIGKYKEANIQGIHNLPSQILLKVHWHCWLVAREEGYPEFCKQRKALTYRHKK